MSARRCTLGIIGIIAALGLGSQIGVVSECSGIESNICLNEALNGDRYVATLLSDFWNSKIGHTHIINKTRLVMGIGISRERIINASNQASHNVRHCFVYLLPASTCPEAPINSGIRIPVLWENSRSDPKRLLEDSIAAQRLFLKGIQAAACKNEPSGPRDFDGRRITNILYVNADRQHRAILAENDLFLAFDKRNLGSEPCPLTGDDRLPSKVCDLFSRVGTRLSGIHRPIHVASMNQGDAPKPIGSDPQRQRKEGNEYGRDSPQPFGGYLGEHRNPLKDDAVFGGAFIIGGVIFFVLMAFGIRELIARRDEDRYLISDSEEQEDPTNDQRDPTESESSTKPR